MLRGTWFRRSGQFFACSMPEIHSAFVMYVTESRRTMAVRSICMAQLLTRLFTSWKSYSRKILPRLVRVWSLIQPRILTDNYLSIILDHSEAFENHHWSWYTFHQPRGCPRTRRAGSPYERWMARCEVGRWSRSPWTQLSLSLQPTFIFGYEIRCKCICILAAISLFLFLVHTTSTYILEDAMAG